jgi:hypothetical protein
LLGALARYGLNSIGTIVKDEMRALVLRGGPLSDARAGGNPRLLRK